ncbi:hypothetical protein, partial [Candidatus Pelagadaptatus aseana]|uniref:hypothetical protein n=1 Tax=Candidatus Pelagadaptatus aseana TaxID=3120508 RepID=UPI003C6F209A
MFIRAAVNISAAEYNRAIIKRDAITNKPVTTYTCEKTRKIRKIDDCRQTKETKTKKAALGDFFIDGGPDGTRTRDPRRDRPV